MANNVRKPYIFYLFSCVLPFIAVISVYGAGNKEKDLARADELINQKKYDEALLVLGPYARKGSDQFEKAQLRLTKIYKIREEFNKTCEEMLRVMIEEPDNSEKLLYLTKKLEELEDPKSAVLSSFINRMRDIAQFNVYRNRLAEILKRGREQIDKGDIQGSLNTYASGLGFMRDEFFYANYGEIINDQVIRETAGINSALEGFPEASSRLGAISSELVQAYNSGDFNKARDAMSVMIPIMDSYIELEQKLYSAMNVFEKILFELQARESDTGDRNYLAFVSQLLGGRGGAWEGMTGAFEAYWKISAGGVIDAIIANTERNDAAGRGAIASGDYAGAANTLSKTDEYLSYAPLLFEKHLNLHEGGKNKYVSLSGQRLLESDQDAFLEIKSAGLASRYLRQAALLYSRSGTMAGLNRSSFTRWQEDGISVSEALALEQRTRDAIDGFETSLNEIIRDAHDEFSAYGKTSYMNNAYALLDNLHSTVIDEKQQSAQRQFSIVNAYLQKNLALRKNELDRGNGYLDGHVRINAEGARVTAYYPAEALEAFTGMLKSVTENITMGNSALENFTNEPAEIINNQYIYFIVMSIQAAVNELQRIRDRGLALSENARNRSGQAEAYRQDAQRLFAEARAAFNRRSYDTAREQIQRAADRINNSLEIQESPALRNAWDSQLLALGQEINRAENEIIIAEVRGMVNNARRVYFAGNLEEAEDLLVRARNRWRVTNPDENDEVVFWLGIVRGALSARTGRVILPTAPLYPEMSQLLSSAQKNYEEGIKLINSGQRVLGLGKFDEARQQTREVKLMFPVNQEAGILELRMDYYTDPIAFNETFEQRLRNAIAGTRSRSIESFAELQNLAEINPRYPNIRSILAQAEIDMGYRPPPPDPKTIARSIELTASANRILEGNVSAQFEIALAQVNEAITLNPENAEAARVKDRLLSRMTTPGGIVLSSQDEEEYQRAVRELQAGNNLVAMSAVERLMQNPRNRNISKLIELQRRIQSLL